MVNWEDGVLVTPASVNEDGTITPAVYSGNTPLSAYNLNKMQSDLQGDTDNKIENLSKIYKNSTITAPTIQGFGKIHKLYGKTEETGEGEKSPDNPYEIDCVGDNDINLYEETSNVEATTAYVGTSFGNISVIANKKYTISFDTNDNGGTVYFSEEIFSNYMAVTCDGNRKSVVMTAKETKTFEKNPLIRTSKATSVAYKIKNIKVQEGEIATEYSKFGEGTVKVTSTDGTNTSNKVISCKPLCCLKDAENNIIAQDYIDFDRQKIIRECEYMILNGNSGNWGLSTTYTDDTYLCAFIINSKFNISRNPFITDKLIYGLYDTVKTKECLGSNTIDSFNIRILKSRLETKDIAGLQKYLTSNPITIVLKRDKVIEEDLDSTCEIVQYENETTISNSDNAEMEVELTKNKAISSINENIGALQEKDNEILENNYSTEEKVIGKWIDEKTLYRKVINFGSLPNSSSKAIGIGVANLGTVTKIEGLAVGSTYTFPMPYASTSNITLNIDLHKVNNNIEIITGTDRSSYTAYIIIEYTKTTD